jgi:hypothetical protein
MQPAIPFMYGHPLQKKNVIRNQKARRAKYNIRIRVEFISVIIQLQVNLRH